jgi:nucleoside-diphosphate-sugar epimerase
VTGASGFLGARLLQALVERFPHSVLVATDLERSPRLDALGARVRFVQADLGYPAACRDLVGPDVGVVFHLASLVSGGAEQDFDAGMKANVAATMNLLEACRRAGNRPRFIFTSSIATFGGGSLPSEVDDWTFQHPQNSYGVAKVVGEQLLNDFSRKGYLDGRGVRFGAVVVRDVPNTAASGYASNLIRETLRGKNFVCPVSPDTRMPIVSASCAVRTLVELSDLEAESLGDWRTLNGRSISPSAGEIAEAVLAAAAASGVTVGTIRFEPDDRIQRIISSWPCSMKAERAARLGLPVDASIESIVRDYIGGTRLSPSP